MTPTKEIEQYLSRFHPVKFTEIDQDENDAFVVYFSRLWTAVMRGQFHGWIQNPLERFKKR